jgi:hypothetical protein
MRKLILLILILLGCAVFTPALALTFNDQYLALKSGSLLSTKDLGQTWQKTILPTTLEAKVLKGLENQLLILWKDKNDLSIAPSDDLGQSFKKTLSYACFDAAPDTWDVSYINGRVHLIYSIKGQLFYRNSDDLGLTFSPARMLAADQIRSALSDTLPFRIIFRSTDTIYEFTSPDNGQNFALAKEIYKTKGSNLRFYFVKGNLLFTENYNNKHLLSLVSGEVFPLYELTSSLSSLEGFQAARGALVLNFRSNEGDPYKYLTVLHALHSPARPINLNIMVDQKYLELIEIGNKLYAVLDRNGVIAFSPLNDQPPSQPIIDTFRSEADKARVYYKASALDPENAPLLFQAQLSWDSKFDPVKTWTFDQLTAEANLSNPLPDGKYYFRIAASDGINLSTWSEEKIFTVDREPPRLTLAELPEVTDEEQVLISGEVTEKAIITVNQIPVELNSSLLFNKIITLSAGDNRITIIATDEAGNSTLESISLRYTLDQPILKVIKPGKSDWFKRSGTALLEIAVSDKQTDIADETEAEILINGLATAETLIYDKSSSKLSGFLPLGNELMNGANQIKVKLKDEKGNAGETTLLLNIDYQAPLIITKNISFAKDKLIIPVIEAESGLDISSSQLHLTSASLEVNGKFSLEKDALVFTPDLPLKDGYYELTVTPRDAVGNLGDKTQLTLYYDSVLALSAAQVSSADVQFSEFKYGPNPFNPRLDAGIRIYYNLSRATEVKLFIFSILGELVCSKNLGANASGAYIWNGRGALGEELAAGVYPIVLAATDTETKKQLVRGKIILLK